MIMVTEEALLASLTLGNRCGKARRAERQGEARGHEGSATKAARARRSQDWPFRRGRRGGQGAPDAGSVLLLCYDPGQEQDARACEQFGGNGRTRPGQRLCWRHRGIRPRRGGQPAFFKAGTIDLPNSCTTLLLMSHFFKVLLRTLERWTVHYDGPKPAIVIETAQVARIHSTPYVLMILIYSRATINCYGLHQLTQAIGPISRRKLIWHIRSSIYWSAMTSVRFHFLMSWRDWSLRVIIAIHITVASRS